MKYRNCLLMLIISVAVFSSCKKDGIKTSGLTSLTVGNFKISGKPVKLNGYTGTVSNNNTNGAQLSLFPGVNNLYFWPNGDSLHPYFVHNNFASSAGETYSLFLCGDTLTKEAVIIKENILYRTDSTAGIRFINLSPNSTPLNITLSTSNTVNEASGLAYKQYTEFKSYPCLYNSAYKFEVRDAVTNNILTTFSFTASSLPRFANVTLVIRGLVGESPALGVTRVNQDR